VRVVPLRRNTAKWPIAPYAAAPASDDSAFVTGGTHVIDGGGTA